MFRHCFLFIFLLTIALKKGTSSDILFFYQDCNVDIPSSADSTCRDERYNLYQTVIDLGHNITLLPDFHQADMSSLLSSSAHWHRVLFQLVLSRLTYIYIHPKINKKIYKINTT